MTQTHTLSQPAFTDMKSVSLSFTVYFVKKGIKQRSYNRNIKLKSHINKKCKCIRKK